jgi:hypothetical protein
MANIYGNSRAVMDETQSSWEFKLRLRFDVLGYILSMVNERIGLLATVKQKSYFYD